MIDLGVATGPTSTFSQDVYLKIGVKIAIFKN